MRKKVHTVEEMEEKARQGYFWEYDLKEWLHISQVDTEEKARRLLKRRNPIRVMKLAQNYPEAVATRLKGFIAWIYNHPTTYICGTLLILLFTWLLPIMYGKSFGPFYDEHLSVSIAMTIMLCIPITVFFIVGFKIRQLDLIDASFVLCVQAENLKEGFIYDEVGRMRRFQK